MICLGISFNSILNCMMANQAPILSAGLAGSCSAASFPRVREGVPFLCLCLPHAVSSSKSFFGGRELLAQHRSPGAVLYWREISVRELNIRKS